MEGEVPAEEEDQIRLRAGGFGGWRRRGSAEAAALEERGGRGWKKGSNEPFTLTLPLIEKTAQSDIPSQT